jgi:DNA polymerase delta subunit 1
VIEPTTGFHNCVLTLDFAALYPSIMISHNFSYDTFVDPRDPKEYKRNIEFLQEHKLPFAIHTVDEKSGLSYTFVEHFKGVLPIILEEGLNYRKQVKKQMKEAEKNNDHARAKMLNGKQLAIKITCNSIYGLTGAGKRGKLPLEAIAASTTANGRKMIMKTKELVQNEFKEHGSQVVYGDTDSVMVRLNNVKAEKSTLPEWFKIGNSMAKRVSEYFGRSISLEMEKVYFPYILFKKKRYAGFKLESIHDKGKIDSRGIELRNSSTTKFVRDTYEQILQSLFYEKDVSRALEILDARLKKLQTGDIDMEDFVLSKNLNKADSDYKNDKIVQKIVIDKMKKRAPGSEYKTGDKCRYVIEKPKDPKEAMKSITERAVDIAYAKEQKLDLDLEYYLENQIVNPITQLMEVFHDDPDMFFAETRRVLQNRRNKQKTLDTVGIVMTDDSKNNILKSLKRSRLDDDSNTGSNKSGTASGTSSGIAAVSGPEAFAGPASVGQKPVRERPAKKQKKGETKPKQTNTLLTSKFIQFM